MPAVSWRDAVPSTSETANRDNNDSMNASDASNLKAHVADLEQQLLVAKSLLRRVESQSAQQHPEGGPHRGSLSNKATVSLPIGPSLHNLLLLSDSALPLGSFAYSSGLESFLAHHKQSSVIKHLHSSTHSHANPTPPSPQPTPLALFHKFLNLSIQSLAYTTVPYVLSAFRDPLGLADLDNDLDASTPCTVQRRASIAQGRALLSVWEKALSTTSRSQFVNHDAEDGIEAATVLELFAADLKVALVSTPADQIPQVCGHLAPLWGAVCLSLGLNLEEAAYLFLLNHAKAVISAAVRASVMGPYMAQTVLAGRELQELIRGCLERVWFVQPEDAGQVVPVMDLWIGRHELLYSRIFNS